MRRVWIEELGTSPEWMPESFFEEYVNQAMGNAAETGHLWAFTWWGSHDINTELNGFQKMEYGVGILDQKNHVKPIGKIVSAMGKKLRGKTYSGNQRQTAMVVPDFGLAPPKTNDWTRARAFMNLLERGKKPCIVLESRAKDEDYLRSRGIKELIPFADAAKV